MAEALVAGCIIPAMANIQLGDLVFDVETVFMFPWAIRYRQLALFGLIEMVIFLAILIFGYVYAWKRGALEWV